MNHFRKRFEHLLFVHYMLGNPEPLTKAEFLKRREGRPEDYEDDAVQQTWFGYQMAMNQVPAIFKDAMLELEEQRVKHGYTPTRDKHLNLPGSLTQGAAAYLISACGDDDKAREIWPFPHSDIKPGHCRHSVIKATALIAADDVRSYSDHGVVNSEGFYALTQAGPGDEFIFEGEVLKYQPSPVNPPTVAYKFTDSEGLERIIPYTEVARLRPVAVAVSNA